MKRVDRARVARATVFGVLLSASGGVHSAGAPFGAGGAGAMPACDVTPRSADYGVRADPVAKRPSLRKDTQFSRMFVTRLSSALRDRPVDFAGHHIITTFGCGSGCVYGGIVDAKTGQAYELPWSLYIAGQLGDWDSALKHEAGSRLLAVRGALNEADEPPQERYFEWTGSALKPVCTRRLALDPRTGMVK